MTFVLGLKNNRFKMIIVELLVPTECPPNQKSQTKVMN